MRFKNWILVVDLIWGEGARAPLEMSGRVLAKVLRESFSHNFGVSLLNAKTRETERFPCVGIWALRAMKGNSDGAGNSDVAGT